MKCLKWIVVLCSYIGFLSAVHISKEGLIPSYVPYEINIMMLFLPYNPNVFIVGDKIANSAAEIAQSRECASVFCFSSEQTDLETLEKLKETYPNIHPYFGLFHKELPGIHSYFPTLPHERPYENFCRFPGSLLEPTDSSRPFLFASARLLPTFYLPTFCEEKKLSKVHFLLLNSGGNELRILQSDPEIVKNAIVVSVKTYHQPIRKNLDTFAELNQFMISCDFELMSHHIYDNVIGDALYVKSKYITAVFRSREL